MPRPFNVRALSIVAMAALLAPASCYTGSARDVSPRDVLEDGGWLLVRDVPFVRQRSEMDCGAAALAMVLSYWGQPTSVDEVTAAHRLPAGRGLKAGELRAFARARGLQAFLVRGDPRDLKSELERGRPVIVGLAKPTTRDVLAHYEVVIGLHGQRQRVLTLDPARGWRENSYEGFVREWVPAQQLTLVVFRPERGRASPSALRTPAPAPPAPESYGAAPSASSRQVRCSRSTSARDGASAAGSLL